MAYAKEQKLEVMKPRPFHVELSHTDIKEADLAARASLLQGKQLDLHDPDMWYFQGRAVALKLPAIPNYDSTHITLVCFKEKGVMTRKAMQDVVLSCLKSYSKK